MLVAERRRANAAAKAEPAEFAVTEKGTVPFSPAVVEKETVIERETVVDSGTVGKKITVVEKTTVQKSPKRATRAQDGHSSGEQCLYAAMWQVGRPEDEGGRSRLVTAGWDRLGAMANLSWKNARAAVFRLIDKLAIEVVAAENSNTRTGRTYRVWGWVALLERRRAAGLEWYVKTRGVEFVRPPAECPGAQAKWDLRHEEKATVVDSETAYKKTTVPFLLTVTEKTTDTVSEKTTDTVPFSPTPSFKNLKIEESTSSSSFAEVATVVRRLAPDADDDFVLTLLDKCRATAADVTAEEIAYFVRAKGEKALNSRRVSGLTGFLLTAVPKCLKGTLLADYRAGKRQERLQEVASWRGILTDPTSTDEIRRIAHDELIRLGDAL
jgi:hypothetical protein